MTSQQILYFNKWSAECYSVTVIYRMCTLGSWQFFFCLVCSRYQRTFNRESENQKITTISLNYSFSLSWCGTFFIRWIKNVPHFTTANLSTFQWVAKYFVPAEQFKLEIPSISFCWISTLDIWLKNQASCYVFEMKVHGISSGIFRSGM